MRKLSSESVNDLPKVPQIQVTELGCQPRQFDPRPYSLKPLYQRHDLLIGKGPVFLDYLPKTRWEACYDTQNPLIFGALSGMNDAVKKN